MRVFIDAITAQILFNLYVGYRGCQALPNKVARILFRSLLITEVLLYLTGFFFHSYMSKDVMTVIMKITGTWYFALIYIFLITIALNLLRRLFRKRIRKWSKSQYRLVKLFFFICTGLFVGGLILNGYLRVLHPKVRHYRVETARPLGDGRDSLRILFVSDLHFSETIGRKHIEKLQALCNQQKADILLVGGDIFDYWSDFGYRDSIPQLISSIHAPLGHYYVMGNHEYRADTEQKKKWVTGPAKGTLLIDSIVYPGNGLFSLIGRDDAYEAHRPSLSELIAEIDSSCVDLPRILLEHQPVQLDSLPGHRIDLALYGHTHHGQVWPFVWVVRAAYEETWGLVRKGSSTAIISSGAGAAGPAIRIGSHSEIVVIDWVYVPQ